MSKKSATTFDVPNYIEDMFRAAATSREMTEAFAKSTADFYAKAWRAVDQLHPQIEGHYYSYDGSGTLTRHKRPDPNLVQK